MDGPVKLRISRGPSVTQSGGFDSHAATSPCYQPPMTPREQTVIDLALKLLTEVAALKKPPESLTAVRLALRVLLPHCPEQWPLTGFWEGVNNPHEIGRSQTMTASLNGIMLQLEKRGWTRRYQS